MTILRDDRAGVSSADRFAVVGVGGAGSRCVGELARILPPDAETISVDRSMEDMIGVHNGRRVALGYPMYEGVRSARSAATENGLVDESDLYRLKVAIGSVSRVFVLAGLGGETTCDLLPSVLRIAGSSGASVLSIVTLPFVFEGSDRRATALQTLDRIKSSGGATAVIDADGLLSDSAVVGGLSEELLACQARVLMTVLTASSTGFAGFMSGSKPVQMFNDGGCDAFVSHVSSDDASQYRKLARECVRQPLTSGLDLKDADRGYVVISGSSGLPAKVLNGVMSVVQKEAGSDTSLSTLFAETPDSGRGDVLHISILAERHSKSGASLDSQSDGEPKHHVDETDIEVESAAASSMAGLLISFDSDVEDEAGEIPDWSARREGIADSVEALSPALL